MLGSMVAHIVLLVVGAAASPPLGPTPYDEVIDTQVHASPTIYDMTVAVGERGPTIEETTPERPGELGMVAGHESGLMGDELAEFTAARYAVAGPADNPDPHLSRYRQTGSTSWSSTLVFSQEPLGNNGLAMVDPYGRDDSLGTDPIDARGHLSGRKLADSLGALGLGLDGIGETAAPRTGLGALERESRYGYRCRMP